MKSHREDLICLGNALKRNPVTSCMPMRVL